MTGSISQGISLEARLAALLFQSCLMLCVKQSLFPTSMWKLKDLQLGIQRHGFSVCLCHSFVRWSWSTSCNCLQDMGAGLPCFLFQQLVWGCPETGPLQVPAAKKTDLSGTLSLALSPKLKEQWVSLVGRSDKLTHGKKRVVAVTYCLYSSFKYCLLSGVQKHHVIHINILFF